MEDLTGIGKLADSQVVKEVYKDAASGPLQEIGGIATDVLKTFRLLTLPFQYAATYQDRWRKKLDEMRDSVPPERQQEASPSIAGPVLRELIFAEEESVASTMYLSLLRRAIDKEHSADAHPAFVHIISQLHPDEALLMWYMKEAVLPFGFVYAYLLSMEPTDWTETKKPQEFKRAKKVSKDAFAAPNNIPTYFDHLRNLNLIFPFKRYIPGKSQFGYDALIMFKEDGKHPTDPEFDIMNVDLESVEEAEEREKTCDLFQLTEFGRAFCKVCCPGELPAGNSAPK